MYIIPKRARINFELELLYRMEGELL